jgi:hypothetical protein
VGGGEQDGGGQQAAELLASCRRIHPARAAKSRP